MIEESYVSFETAKLLKEKGFYKEFDWVHFNKNGDIDLYYDGNEDGYGTTNDYKDKNFIYIRPTQQMAMHWLREVHQIAIATNCWFGGERFISWHCTIMCYGDNLKTQQDVELPYVATYEEACEAAIKYCLENLI